MKRIGLAVVTVLFVSVLAFGAAREGGAQSDDIPILQTQVAELDARVTALEAQQSPAASIASPVAAGPALLVSGNGEEIVDLGPIPAGVYIVTMTVAGSSPDRVDAYITGIETGWQEAWFVSESPPFRRERVWSNSRDESWLLAVRGVAVPWVITIEPVSP